MVCTLMGCLIVAIAFVCILIGIWLLDLILGEWDDGPDGTYS